MIRQKVTIVNKLGLHARAAAKMVSLASKFGAEIEVKKQEKQVNAKSIMGIMMLAAAQGAQLELTATGTDEDLAMRELVSLIEDGFGEEG